MARGLRIELGALNIAATPHPHGVYEETLRGVANKEVRLRGADWAKITAPETTKEGLLFGRILVWTKIEKRGPWVNTKTNKEATDAEKDGIVLVEDLHPNYRTFYYSFRVADHLMIVEFRNEFGQTFGPNRAEDFFANLLSPDILGPTAPEFNITVVPEDNSLDIIFSIPHLRYLEITVVRPNAEDLADDAARVLEKLVRQGAKSQTLELTKAAKVATLVPDQETRTLAKIATMNGYVKGRGSDDDGSPRRESTKEHPKVRPVDIPAEGANIVQRFLTASLRLF